MPKGEKLLWQHLRNNNIGFRFRRQYGIGIYTADFYCPILRLVIEVDGLSHAGDEAQKCDVRRDSYMRSLGLTIKRYTCGQVWNELDSVKQDIVTTCEQLARVRGSGVPPPTPSF